MAFNYYTRSAVGFVAMNANNGATADKAVLQALMYATDRQDSVIHTSDGIKKQVTKLKVKGGGSLTGYVFCHHSLLVK